MKNCTPLSSSCVIWNGPRIQCIDQCQNDSIEDIVYRLADVICSLAEMQQADCNCENKVTSQIFECFNNDQDLLAGTPTYSITTEELLEALFANFICTKGEYNITYQDVLDKINFINLPLSLPDCLQYEEDKQTITELTYDQYILLLAEYVCNLYNTIVSQQNSITNIENDITIIQQWINDYKPADDIIITSSCASAPNPGEEVEISIAFEAFESHYCDYISILGSTTQWTTGMSAMCPDLPTEPQMQDLDLTMQDLPNWINNPITVAENYTNLWLTVCDLRTGLQTLLESNAILPCILAAPEDVTIDSYSTISADISWTPSSLTNIQSPTGFILEIYEWNGSQGSLVYTHSYASDVFTTSVTSAGILPNALYLVKLRAIYDCGESESITTVGKLKDSIILYKINVSESSDSGITSECDEGGGASDYPYVTTTTTFELVNASTGVPVTIATDVVIITQYTVVHPEYGTFTTNVVNTIVAGTSDIDYEYVSLETILSGGTCQTVTKALTCGVLINNSSCEWGTGITEC